MAGPGKFPCALNYAMQLPTIARNDSGYQIFERNLDDPGAYRSQNVKTGEWVEFRIVAGEAETFSGEAPAEEDAVRIPAHREHPFWFNVNTYSGGT